MDLWESPLWPLLESGGEWVSWKDITSRCPGGLDEARDQLKRFVDEGFLIREDPSRGCFVNDRPDRLYPPWIHENLDTRAFGKNLIYAHTMGSTQLEAVERAVSGAPHGTVVLCEYQRSGRGRRGRTWVSPPGANVLMSVLIRWTGDDHPVFVWTQMASVAVAEAVERTVGETAWIKWPNDIYLRDRKLCGILSEWHDLDGGESSFIVVGIGLNVHAAPEKDQRAICISQMIKNPPRRADLVRWILEGLETWHAALGASGPDVLREPWIRRSWLLGKPVRIEDAGRITAGKVENFLEDGTLLLLRDDGRRETFVAGDVSVLQADNHRQPAP
jgi:BirA family biotin operon repressor/biotin-[acetyl-CoA-carboxylase] ligase